MRVAGCRLASRKLALVCIVACVLFQAQARAGAASRVAQLVEANVIATHAYQVLLASKSGRGDAACFAQGSLSDDELRQPRRGSLMAAAALCMHLNCEAGCDTDKRQPS